MNIDWTDTPAAIWRRRREALRPVAELAPIRLADLLGIEHQKAELVANTERFLEGHPANNTLLWGARGTGKSSLVKALLNAYHPQGLRLIEVDRDDLVELPEIVDLIRDLPYRFIIFCDDLAFEPGERGYRALKSALEGSIEPAPDNVRFYATSNRRHLVPEFMKDNHDSRVENGILHPSDSIEETISLSDRFGLWLSFHPVNEAEYLAMVDHYFRDWQGDRGALHTEASRFARSRGSRSGRTARQFRDSGWMNEPYADGEARR